MKPVILLYTVSYCCYNRQLRVQILVILLLKSSPVTGLEWPRGFQEAEVPRFQENGTGWW